MFSGRESEKALSKDPQEKFLKKMEKIINLEILWAEQCDLACSQAGNLKSHYQNVHGKKFKKTSSCKGGGGGEKFLG